MGLADPVMRPGETVSARVHNLANVDCTCPGGFVITGPGQVQPGFRHPRRRPPPLRLRSLRIRRQFLETVGKPEVDSSPVSPAIAIEQGTAVGHHGSPPPVMRSTTISPPWAAHCPAAPRRFPRERKVAEQVMENRRHRGDVLAPWYAAQRRLRKELSRLGLGGRIDGR